MKNNETTYSLAAIDKPNITGIRTLTEDEYYKIFEEIRLLEKFSKDESLYNLIEFNYHDLKTKVEFYKNAISESHTIDYTKISNQFIDINRLILNLLSSIRTYLDHTETRYKREFGNNSEEFKLFKNLTSKAFDENFSYRLLSKLRNYSQHCGLPSGSLNIKSNDKGSFLTISISRDSLLENYDSWGAIIKPELENQPETFDIFPLLEDKVEILKNINFELNKFDLLKLTNEANNLLSLIMEVVNSEKGVPMLLKIKGEIGNPKMTIKWFPYQIISKITGVIFEVNDKKIES